MTKSLTASAAFWSPRACAAALASLALLLAAFALPARAQGAGVSEYAVKAALFFRLPQFVYRPDALGDPAVEICLLGGNPFGSALDKLAQAPIGGRPVKLMKLVSAADAATCDFVFVARSESAGLDGILRRLAAHSVVTVSDIDGFAQAGGMVEFALGGESSPISLVLNRKAAQRQGIVFNAQLLRLARVAEP